MLIQNHPVQDYPLTKKKCIFVMFQILNYPCEYLQKNIKIHWNRYRCSIGIGDCFGFKFTVALCTEFRQRKTGQLSGEKD